MKQLEERHQQMALRVHQFLSNQLTDLAGEVANAESCLNDAARAFNSRMDRMARIQEQVDAAQSKLDEVQSKVDEAQCKLDEVQSELDESQRN